MAEKSEKVENKSLIPIARIERKIYLIHGQNVMLDSDLAELYQVETFNLNKAVKRNNDRFPDDFMFQLTKEDAESLIFQIGISNTEAEYLRDKFGVGKKQGRGGRRHLPYVFTEQGVAMLSSVLHSFRAVQVNIEIMRAFVKLRVMFGAHEDLARKVEEMEKKYDKDFKVVFDALRNLLVAPDQNAKKIGFVAGKAKKAAKK